MPRPVLLAVDGDPPAKTAIERALHMSGMELMARVHGLDPAAKRRFHGPGRSPRSHLGFVVVHVQPFALALVVAGFGWTAAAAIYGLVVAGAVVVLAAPPGRRRPVAFAATTLASAIALTAVTVPAAVAWFAPVLLIKLLLGHPAPRRGGAAGGHVSELQQLLDRLVAAGAPGAAGWVRNERGSLGAASGLANRRTRQPMRPELRFRAGSVTKSLVAAVVLRLAAEGRLSLADPLERWLPGSLRYGDRVSLRQLLNHTGGVPHRTATLEQALYASRPGRLRAWTPQALVAMVADQPPAFPAGTAWSYSNTGYVLLGVVVEAASRRALGQELGRSILGPLGLRDTLLPDSAPEIPGPSARGYSLPLGPQGEALDGPLLDFTVQNPSWAGAAGALVSTLPDLTRFFRALLGGWLLPPPLLAEMTTMVEVPPGSIPLPLYDRYGLGLLEVETPAGPLLGNAGGIPGFLSIVLSTPDGHRQLGLMINALLAPAPVYEAFIQGSRALGRRLLS